MTETTASSPTARPWEGVCESCDSFSDHLIPQSDDEGHRWLVCPECA